MLNLAMYSASYPSTSFTPLGGGLYLVMTSCRNKGAISLLTSETTSKTVFLYNPN